MYLVLIGWLYVVLMFAVAQETLVRGMLVLFFLGLLPVLFLGWLGRSRRRRNEETGT
ncbi:hypothetical protein [Gulbenkiania mobilis]|uniref:NADH dehydrogenase subunit 6 n=1 Tax=Gulbenkiania mobilis TaxID=397457 RepID=A0ABY2CVJ0_GULMO|nr:hypothetical protein EV669_106127 [Gulbenkiania mobilis]